jgi:hypothetical protein
MTSFNMDDFGNYTDLTKVTDKKVTEDDKWASFNGNSFSRQNGNATSYQIGNRNAFQHGYSNSLIEGMSFSTSLAGTFSTTVGLAIASHLGAKAAVFAGLDASINASAAVKVLRGGAFTFGITDVWETTEQETQSTAKKLVISNAVKQVITDEIAVYAGSVSRVAGGSVTETIGSRNITCAVSYTLTAPAVTLDGPGSLTAKTLGDLTLTSGTSLKMLGLTASMSFLGLIKIG